MLGKSYCGSDLVLLYKDQDDANVNMVHGKTSGEEIRRDENQKKQTQNVRHDSNQHFLDKAIT